MTMTDWPPADRPREKLLEKGATALTDAELVAIFLHTGTRGQTALDVARQLLVSFGCLKKLLRAPPHEFMRWHGMGNAKYAALQAAVELGRRFISETVPTGSVMTNSRIVQQFLSGQLRHHSNEVFACLFMDNHFRLLSFEEMFQGTVNETNVYPREIVRRALMHNAAKIILAHNHPSGRAEPSEADKEVTRLIQQALGLVEVVVVDHVIVGNPGCFSFAEWGLV
jgi:DNA repair protein RadC